jgi:hypothetical protein
LGIRRILPSDKNKELIIVGWGLAGLGDTWRPEKGNKGKTS